MGPNGECPNANRNRPDDVMLREVAQIRPDARRDPDGSVHRSGRIGNPHLGGLFSDVEKGSLREMNCRFRRAHMTWPVNHGACGDGRWIDHNETTDVSRVWFAVV